MEDKNSGKSTTNKSKRGSGIGIIPMDIPEDEREGWLDPSNGAIVYNVGHEFYKRVADNPYLRDYNLTRVIISTLIKAKNNDIAMDANTAFNFFEDMLHRVWL